MGKQTASVALRSPNETGSDCKNVVVESEEASEEEEFEEESDEVELSEVEPDEEHCEEDPDEEEESCEDGPTEEPCEEVLREEESSEELDEDTSEEDPSEVAQASSDSDDSEVHQFYSTLSNSGKNIADDPLEGSVQKRPKQDLNSKLESRDGSSGTDIQRMPKKLTRDGIVSENQESSGSSSKNRRSRWGKQRLSRWDTEYGADRKADDGGDVATKKRKAEGASDTVREKLTEQRSKIISDQIQRDPAYKPASNYKQQKFSKKLYLPVNEYPGYSFVGLILGHHGDTQKRMQKESGAKIRLRGKDSVKEYKGRQGEGAENENLHVHIEAHTQESLDAAVAMVEKLLFPLDISKTQISCEVCGDASHLTTACPLTASNPGTVTINHQIDSFTKLGNRFYTPFTSLPSSTIPWMANPASGALLSENNKPVKMIDEAKIFVGYLPDSVNEDKLIELFLPFGQICEAKIIKHESTGSSKGYAFIKYANAIFAAEAVTRMNGYRIERNMLAVRVAGFPPSTETSNHQTDSLTNLGIELSVPFSGPLVPSSTILCMANPASGALSSENSKHVKKIDEAKIFVCYLPGSVNEDKLIELFLPFGQIREAKIIKDKGTGLSKGYAFIEYSDAIFAAEAVARMNGYRIEGKVLVVRVADRPPSAPINGTSDHSTDSLTNLGNKLSVPFRGSQVPSSTIPLMAKPASGALSSENSNPVKKIDEAKIFVCYLPGSVNEDKLIELFLPFGQIREAKIIKDNSTGLSKGYAFIEYSDAIFAAEAVARMNGYRIEGKVLVVRVADRPPSTPVNGTSDHPTDSLTNLGNELSVPFRGSQVPGSTIPLMANPASGALSSENSKPVKEIDEARIFVGSLPDSVNEDKLIELFLPFGQICEAKIIKHKSTGLSKGYAFIKYVDAIFAAEAVVRMNGYRIEGKMLVVRIAGRPPSTPGPGTSDQKIDSFIKLENGLSTPFSGPQAPSCTIPLMAKPASGALSSENRQPVKEIDEATLYVGHLPHSVNEDKLIELFLPFGQICKATITKDKSTGLSKGYGFIEYVDAIFAAEAVARMNGYNIEGKMLAVRVAGRPPSTQGTGTSDHQIDSLNKLGNKLSAPFSGPQVPRSTMPMMANPAPGALSSENSNPLKGIDEATVYVGYLPQSVNEDKLIELFLPFGQICKATIIKDRSTGLSKGYAFIEYVDATFAAEAVAQMNGYRIEGKMLAVRVAGRPSTVNINPVPQIPQSFTHMPTYPAPAIAQGIPCLVPAAIAQGNPVPGVPQSFTHLRTYQDPAAIAQGNPSLVPAVITHGNPVLLVPQSFTHLPTYPGPAAITQGNPLSWVPENYTHLPTYRDPAAIAQGNTSLVPAAITQGNPALSIPQSFTQGIHVLSVPQSFTHLPTFPGHAAITQGSRGPVDWPGPPGSMLPDPCVSFPKSSDFPLHTDPVSRQSPASFGSSLTSVGITSSRELAQFPGYLNSL